MNGAISCFSAADLGRRFALMSDRLLADTFGVAVHQNPERTEDLRVRIFFLSAVIPRPASGQHEGHGSGRFRQGRHLQVCPVGSKYSAEVRGIQNSRGAAIPGSNVAVVR